MIELLTNMSLGIVRIPSDIPTDNVVLDSISASMIYSIVEYPVNDEIISSMSLSSATELKDMRTKIVRTYFR